MKYLTLRIYLYFISGIMIAALLAIVIVSWNYKRHIHSTLEQNLIRGAVAAENVIDAAEHAKLSADPAGRETRYYRETLERLNMIREVCGFAYIYTLFRSDDGRFYFVFDTADYHVAPGEKLSYLREYEHMPAEVKLAYQSGVITITEDYYNDEWGTFKSAFLPVMNQGKNVSHIVGVDYDATYIASLNRKVVMTLITAVAAAMPFIIILIVLLRKDIVRHINYMSEELVSSQKEIVKLKNYLSNIIESMPSILISTDADGYVIEWNKSAESYTGIKREDAFGKRVDTLIDYLSSYTSAFTDIRSDHAPREYRRQRLPDQKEMFVDILIYPLIANGIEGVVIKIDDVTEVETQQRQLIQSQKMESLGILAGGIAHDFNNVLGGIIGALSLMKLKSGEIPPEAAADFKKYIRIIDEASLHGKHLASQLLTISKKSEDKTARIDLAETVRKIIEICRSTFESTVTLRCDNNKTGFFTEANESQIEQVLMNLCINSYHAMTLMRDDNKSGGEIKISLDRFVPDEEYTRKHNPDFSSYIRITVSDTGIGIKPETISDIFEPFFSTKKESGSGLGLYMVSTIIKRHNGFVDVKSEYGKGTDFSVYLPESYEITEVQKDVDDINSLKHGSGLIMVVDDQNLVRKTTRMMLERSGFDVIESENGADAIILFKQKQDLIKGAVIDLVMPGLSGLDVAAELKKHNPAVKTILITGYSNYELDMENMKWIDCILLKPFNIEAFNCACVDAKFFNI